MSTAAPTPGIYHELPRGARLSALWALFWFTIRQHTHGKRIWVIGLLYFLPCALTMLIRSLPNSASAEELEFAFVLNLIPHVLAPFTALLYAAGIISDEVEDQTLTYLLVRSVSRHALYVTKLLATVLVCGILVALATVFLYLTIYWNTQELAEDFAERVVRVAGIFALAQAGYCALFGAIGLIMRRSLIGGVVYIFAVEGIIANIDFVVRSWTIVYFVRTLLVRAVEFPAGILREAQQEWMMNLNAIPEVQTCVVRLLLFFLVPMALSALWFSIREYHVKTPGE